MISNEVASGVVMQTVPREKSSTLLWLDGFRESARRFSGRTAILNSEGEALSYAQLWNASELIASHLLKLSNSGDFSKKKEPIVIVGHKHPLGLACFLGCAKVGHPYVPLDDSLPTERILAIINQLDSCFIFNVSAQYDDSLFDTLPKHRYRCLDAITLSASVYKQTEPLGSLFANSASDLLELVDTSNWVSGEDTLYIIFTSGSTGAPKGVQITAANHNSFLPWACSLVGARQFRSADSSEAGQGRAGGGHL